MAKANALVAVAIEGEVVVVVGMTSYDLSSDGNREWWVTTPFDKTRLRAVYSTSYPLAL